MKAPLGGAVTGSNPTDRGKLGTKRHILTDKNGIPISAVIAPANRHDIKAATYVIDNAVAKRPVAFLSTAKEEEAEEGTISTYALTWHATPNQQNRP